MMGCCDPSTTTNTYVKQNIDSDRETHAGAGGLWALLHFYSTLKILKSENALKTTISFFMIEDLSSRLIFLFISTCSCVLFLNKVPLWFCFCFTNNIKYLDMVYIEGKKEFVLGMLMLRGKIAAKPDEKLKPKIRKLSEMHGSLEILNP